MFLVREGKLPERVFMAHGAYKIDDFPREIDGKKVVFRSKTAGWFDKFKLFEVESGDLQHYVRVGEYVCELIE